MPNNLTTNYGSVVVDTSLVPYIRAKDVEFVGRNLKPYKISKIFFDDIAVNQFCQVGNKAVLDSKKLVVVSKNNTTTIAVNDVVFQGTSNTVNTFNGIVDSWNTGTSTITIRSLSGNFDDQAQLYVEATTAHDSLTIGTVFANCNVSSVSSANTSDTFKPGQGVICVDAGNVFAKVIATSGENVLYLNQNFVTLNVNANGVSVLSSMGTDYKVGDIVYQTADGSKDYHSSTFRGIVEFYNVESPGTLVVTPLSGSIVANSTATNVNANCRIWNATNTQSTALTANSFNLTGFAANKNVASFTINSSTGVVTKANTIKITSYTHTSGVLANTLNPNTDSVILSVIDASNHPTMNGNLIYFTAGTGVGTLKRIVAIDGRTAVLNSALLLDYTSNTHYSVGNFIVDQYGTQAGIFHIPAFSGFKFKTGNRVLTITDTNTYNDPDYTMRAAATYAASGIMKTTQRIQTTPILAPLPEVEADNLVTPVSPAERLYNAVNNKSPVTGSTGSTTPRIPLGDGLSQTFFTPKPTSNKQDYGIFASSIDLFFKNKPNVANGSMQLPVTVKIAEVLNGYPTKNYLAAKTVQAKDVNVSELPSTSNAATITKFTFDDPVYLQPNREYAIIVGSDSPEYELYIAEIGETVLGASPERRISEQPYAGSLFRSQNSSTWTAYQNQDLMFRINKAVFGSSGTATFNIDETPLSTLQVDRFMLTSEDLKFPVGIVDYKVKGVYVATNTYDSGVYTIPYRDVEYGVLQDKSSKSGSVNRRLIQSGNANSYIVTVEMSSSDPDVSPVINAERMSLAAVNYNINNAGLSNTHLSIVNKGSGYNATVSAATHTSANAMKGSSNTTMNNYSQLYREVFYANNFNIGFYAATITGDGSGATAFAVANTDGSNTVNYFVTMTPGEGYIDKNYVTVASGNATVNVTASAIAASEVSKSGGNIRSKYISREIVLEDGFESGDLRVYMDAIRQSPTDIQVYYKVVSEDDIETISEKSWRRMSKVKDIYSQNPKTLIGLEFRPSLDENRIVYTENGVVYPIGGKFKRFMIKVCMTSPDPSLVPRIRNLRIIATPEG